MGPLAEYIQLLVITPSFVGKLNSPLRQHGRYVNKRKITMTYKSEEQISLDAFKKFLDERLGHGTFTLEEGADPNGPAPFACLSVLDEKFDIEITNIFSGHKNGDDQFSDPGVMLTIALTATRSFGGSLPGIYIFRPLPPYASLQESSDEIVDGIQQFARNTAKMDSTNEESFTSSAGQRWSIRKLALRAGKLEPNHSLVSFSNYGLKREVIPDFTECVNNTVTKTANSDNLMETQNPIILIIRGCHLLTMPKRRQLLIPQVKDHAKFHSIYMVSTPGPRSPHKVVLLSGATIGDDRES